MSLEIGNFSGDCLVPQLDFFIVEFVSSGLDSPGLLVSFLLAHDLLLASHVKVSSRDSKLNWGSLLVSLLM
jgi:hypothetical protein